MTEGRFLSDIEEDILALLRKRGAMSVPEICEAMDDEDLFVEGCIDRLVRNRKVRISPTDDRVKKVILGAVGRPLGGEDE